MNAAAHWLPEVLTSSYSKDEAVFRLFIPADLAHFPGHFPGLPLLPGVIQIDWAVRFARQHFDLPVQCFSALKNLKFTAPVLPDSTLTLDLRWQAERQRLDFGYRDDSGRAYASGQIVFASAPA